MKHFEARVAALDGKAMIVCMSRRICVALYDAIVKLRPEWHSDDDEAGAIKVVMTGAASDPPAWQAAYRQAAEGAAGTARQARQEDPNDPLKLVIVRDMWLTGFDAPCMHTMYVDKPMKGHGLMQAIARVNRVFRDKPAGLVVDYIGIAQNLKSALGQYSRPRPRADRHRRGRGRRVLLEKYEIVRAMFRPDTTGGFDYRPALDRRRDAADAARHHGGRHRLGADAPAGGRRQGDDARKARSGRTGAMPTRWWRCPRRSRWRRRATRPRDIREEVGFFQAIRAALVKSVPGDGKKSAAERELAIQQIVSRAVVSTEIVDIMKAAGLESPTSRSCPTSSWPRCGRLRRRTSPSRRSRSSSTEVSQQ